jgi:hypothetical protein
MQVRFWGVRGSVPWAIPAAIGHGCNTPCLEVTDEHTRQTVIFDAGSGIVGLGPAIAGPPRDLPIVLTSRDFHFSRSCTSRAGPRASSPRPSNRGTRRG